jgi:hypothetical protein
MSLDELRQEWRTQVERSLSTAELNDLLNVVQARCATMERHVRGRDIGEIVAAVIVVAAVASMWPLYRSSLAAVLGVLLILLGVVLIIYMLMSRGSPAPLAFQASVLECSRHHRAWLDHQIRLLRTVIWWYIGPLFAGSLLLQWGLTGGGIAFGLVALVLIAVGAGIVLLNLLAARRHLQPVRDDLSRLIAALESAERE